MKTLTRCLIAVAVLLAANIGADAAEIYRFQTTTQGVYPEHHEGTVLIDGKHWRMSFDAIPDYVTDFNALIGTEDGTLIAINDSNHTWFHLKSRERLGIANSLFTFFAFGEAAKASKIRITLRPAEPDRGRDATAGPTSRIAFSYRIDVKVSGENVQGEVSGEIRVWTTAGPERQDLPWRAVDLRTGLDAVDEALRIPLAGARGLAWQSETEVSRRLAGGEVLKQTIRRTLGPLTHTQAEPREFTVPADYRYQEPVIGSFAPSK